MSDPILLWNEVALEANRTSHTNGQGEQAGPPLSARALAVVHLAMYDAFAAIETSANLPPYLTGLPPAPANPSANAAVAGAAHHSLSALFPSQRPYLDSILSAAGDEGSASHNFGVAIATALLTDRAGDPGAGSVTYRPSSDPGAHRPDPDNAGQGFHAPDYGRLSKGFAITGRHRLAPPPFGPNDGDYLRALREVRGKGVKPELMGALPPGTTARDPNETLIGIYWGYDGASGLGTPPRLYNQILRKVSIEKGYDVTANVILFTLANVALADAGILCWDEKYAHNFWRPVLGIREHDLSMGPDPAPAPTDKISADCDPAWLPLGAPNTNSVGRKNFTPSFPAYPSGHATFGAAALHTARLIANEGGRLSTGNLVRDDLFRGLSFVSDELNGISLDNGGTVRPRHVRAFPDGLWQMIEENGRSRVYLGVHWVFDAFAVTETGDLDLSQSIGGVHLGLTVAEDIFDAFSKARTSKTSWKSSVAGGIAPTVPKGVTETFSSSFRPDAPAR